MNHKRIDWPTVALWVLVGVGVLPTLAYLLGRTILFLAGGAE